MRNRQTTKGHSYCANCRKRIDANEWYNIDGENKICINCQLGAKINEVQ